jgi:hypothetical protein
MQESGRICRASTLHEPAPACTACDSTVLRKLGGPTCRDAKGPRQLSEIRRVRSWDRRVLSGVVLMPVFGAGKFGPLF